MDFSSLHGIASNKTLLRYILRLLRHTPEAAGLSMAKDGWVEKSQLLMAIQCARVDCLNWGLDDLDQFLSQHNESQRFSWDGTRCRANYGHSTISFQPLTLMELPALLFHGTCQFKLEEICNSGLLPMGRLHVQLTARQDYARRVANQHMRPVVLSITPSLLPAGLYGYPTESHVWLTNFVPPICIAIAPFCGMPGAALHQFNTLNL
jgi:putative RNA 2'-phosphotransferase